MATFSPQARTQRPLGGRSKLIRNHKYALPAGLCFAAIADQPFGLDQVSGLASAALPAADSLASSPMGNAWKFTGNSTNSGLSFGVFNPITTSDGAGGGDFTILAYANPSAGASINCLVDQRKGAASNEQIGLFANSSKSLVITSGVMALVTASTAGVTQGCQSVAGMVDGLPHVWEGRRLGTAHSIWRDGVDVTNTSDVSANVVWSVNQSFEIGAAAALVSATFGANCSVCVALGYNNALSDSASVSIGLNIFQLFERASARKSGAVISGAGVTGTIAAAEANDVLAATGSVQTVGNIATTEAPDVLAATGFLSFVGTIAATEANDTLAAAGKVLVTGTAPLVEAGDVLAAAGTVSQPAITGTIAVTEAGDTFAARSPSAVGVQVLNYGVMRRRREEYERREEEALREFAQDIAEGIDEGLPEPLRPSHEPEPAPPGAEALEAAALALSRVPAALATDETVTARIAVEIEARLRGVAPRSVAKSAIAAALDDYDDEEESMLALLLAA